MKKVKLKNVRTQNSNPFYNFAPFKFYEHYSSQKTSFSNNQFCLSRIYQITFNQTVISYFSSEALAKNKQLNHQTSRRLSLLELHFPLFPL